MKYIFNITLACFLAQHISYSQPDSTVFHSAFEQESFTSLNALQIMVAADPAASLTKYNYYKTELSTAIDKLSKKQRRIPDKQLVEQAFYFIHRKKLDHYENYVSFADLFKSGKYDCVTGTALYAVILDSLGYNYTIYEFDYHVFLVAQLDTDSVLIEATDPLNGFVANQEEIARRIAIYGKGLDPNRATTISSVGSNKDQGSHHVNNRISLKELAGLQYFNLSIKAFNDKEITLANNLIQKAKFLYPSYRIQEIRRIFEEQSKLVSKN